MQDNQKKYFFLSDYHWLLIATQGRPNIEADPTPHMCSRRDLKTKYRKENLKGFLSSHNTALSMSSQESTHSIFRTQRQKTSNHFHIVRILQVLDWTSEVLKDFDTLFIILLITVNRSWILGGNVEIWCVLTTYSTMWNRKFFIGLMLEGDHWV